MLASESLNQKKNESQGNETTDVKDLTDAMAEAMDLANYVRFTLKGTTQNHVLYLNTRDMTKPVTLH